MDYRSSRRGLRVLTPCSAADLELFGLRDNGEAMRKPNSGKAVRQEQIVIRVFIRKRPAITP